MWTVELAAVHAATRNIIYLKAPHRWLADGDASTPPPGGATSLRQTAQSESIVSLSLVSAENGRSDQNGRQSDDVYFLHVGYNSSDSWFAPSTTLVVLADRSILTFPLGLSRNGMPPSLQNHLLPLSIASLITTLAYEHFCHISVQM